MEDDTTTAADVPATGADEALPVEQNDQAPADVQTTDEPSDPSQDDSETAAPSVDDKLKKYADSQGIQLDSPSAIKAAGIAMKAQSEATRNYHKSNELEKATNISQEQLPADITPQQAENVRIRNLEMKLDIQSWKMQNQDKLALEPQMIDVLKDPNMRALVQEGSMSLDTIYKIAKADAPDNSAAVKSQGAREALTTLAHKQQAAVPNGHATTSATPKEKPFEELSLEEMRQKLGVHRR